MADVDQVAIHVDGPEGLLGGEAEGGQALCHHVAEDLGVGGLRFAGERDPVVVQVVHPVVVELHPVSEHVAVVRVDDLAVVDGDPGVAFGAGYLDAACRSAEPVPKHLSLDGLVLVRRAHEVLVLAVASEHPRGNAAVDHAVLDPDVLVRRVLGVPCQEVDGPAAGPDPAMVEGDVGAGVEPDGVGAAEAQREVAERDVVAVREEDRIILFPGQRQTEVVGVGLIGLVVVPALDSVVGGRQPDVDLALARGLVEPDPGTHVDPGPAGYPSRAVLGDEGPGLGFVRSPDPVAVRGAVVGPELVLGQQVSELAVADQADVDGFVEESAADDSSSIELRAGRRVRPPPHVLAVEDPPGLRDRVPPVFGSGHEELGEQRVDEGLAVADWLHHDPLLVQARDRLQFDRLDVVAAVQVYGPAVLCRLDSVGYRSERILRGAGSGAGRARYAGRGHVHVHADLPGVCTHRRCPLLHVFRC